MGEDELSKLFAPFGKVASARIITSRGSGTSKGFGFVQMSDASEATKAIAGLDDKKMAGRKITVKEARTRARSRRRGRQSR